MTTMTSSEKIDLYVNPMPSKEDATKEIRTAVYLLANSTRGAIKRLTDEQRTQWDAHLDAIEQLAKSIA